MMRISSVLVGLTLVASACADRFGDIGEIEPPGTGGSRSSTATQCTYVPLPIPLCQTGAPAMQYDGAGCPVGYVCNDTEPDSTAQGGAVQGSSGNGSGGVNVTTTVIGNATCMTNGCWAHCSFAHTGGAYSTTFAGNTACKYNYAASNYGDTPASTSEQTTSVIDGATCVSNGCWTNCVFPNQGSGGTSSLVVGNTTCRYDYNDGTVHHTATATCMTQGCRASCAFVDGSGGTRSTTVAGNTTCAATTPTYSAKHVGDAVCYSNGCHSYCEFMSGSGGTAGVKLVGNTTCDSSMGGATAMTTTLTYVK